MAKKIKVKQLTFTIHSTTRKGREFERALRTFADKYEEKAGVYDLDVAEINSYIYSEEAEMPVKKVNGKSKSN